MTKPDESSETSPTLRRTLIGVAAGIAILFMAGLIAGFLAAAFDHGGPTLQDGAIISAMVAVIAAIVFACWKFWPAGTDEPLAQSTRRARKWMYAIIAFSFLAGLGFAFAESPVENPLFSNGPLNPTLAAFALIGWLIVTPALSWAWWRNVDELEASFYRDSSVIAVHGYFFLAPSWWFASRAGWVPDQDPMVVFLIVTAIWLAAWAYKKFS